MEAVTSITFGNLVIKQLSRLRDKEFRIFDNDEKQPHLLAEVYMDENERYVFCQRWNGSLTAEELNSILAFMQYKNSHLIPKLEPRDGEVIAPWTQSQVDSLNGFQQSGAFHPFTCVCNSVDKTLIATTNGWTCKKCDYTQKWAHDFMADWRWSSAEAKKEYRI